MSSDSPISNHARALILAAIVIFLASALTVSTVHYQRPNDPLCMRLGAGFPVAFVCDASGESPLSSVGRIDWADRNSLNMVGFIIDLLLYSFMLWGGLLLWQRLSEQRKYRMYMQQIPSRYNTGYRRAGN